MTYPFIPDEHGLNVMYRDTQVSFDDNLLGTEGTESKTLESEVARLAQLPLLFHPGDKWQYSFSTDVLGLLVEKLSGQPLDEFLEQRILAPLGMSDTSFWVPAAKWPRFAACYAHTSLSQGGKSFEFQKGHSATAGYELMDSGAHYKERPTVLRCVPDRKRKINEEEERRRKREEARQCNETRVRVNAMLWFLNVPFMATILIVFSFFLPLLFFSFLLAVPAAGAAWWARRLIICGFAR